MEACKIILLSVAAAVGYGILHDQVTARVCVEYFTVGHPRIFPTEDPTLLAMGWGTLATWWFGLFLGIPLALISRLGPPPRLPAGALLKPILILLLGVGSIALVAGCIGYLSAGAAFAPLVEPAIVRLPLEKRAPYLADSCAHAAAYVAGFILGTMVWAWAWRQRDAEKGR